MIKLSNKITKDISKKLMIDISEEEATAISNLIMNSVKRIEEIKNIDLSKVEPMDYPNVVINNSFREDEIEEFDNKEGLLELAPEKKDGYIKV